MSKIIKNKKGINPRYFLNERSSDAYLEPRITIGRGEVPGLKPGAQGVSIIVDRNPQYQREHDGAWPYRVLAKPIGMYPDFKSANISGTGGERYYMTDEEIEAYTMSDSARPNPNINKKTPYTGSSWGYSRVSESKQPTTKTLMEGFKRFLNEEELPVIDEARSLAQALLDAYKNTPNPERYPSIQNWIIEDEVEPAVVAWSEKNGISDDMYRSPEFEATIERAKELVVSM